MILQLPLIEQSIYPAGLQLPSLSQGLDQSEKWLLVRPTAATKSPQPTPESTRFVIARVDIIIPLTHEIDL
jgi:hypothetical protein